MTTAQPSIKAPAPYAPVPPERPKLVGAREARRDLAGVRADDHLLLALRVKLLGVHDRLGVLRREAERPDRRRERAAAEHVADRRVEEEGVVRSHFGDCGGRTVVGGGSGTMLDGHECLVRSARVPQCSSGELHMMRHCAPHGQNLRMEIGHATRRWSRLVLVCSMGVMEARIVRQRRIFEVIIGSLVLESK